MTISWMEGTRWKSQPENVLAHDITPPDPGVVLELLSAFRRSKIMFAGVSLGWVEGIELNFLGLITGVDLRRPAIKLPGWGRIGLQPVTW